MTNKFAKKSLLVLLAAGLSLGASMNVLLVSQCSKGALVETRRILDQFAERRGERTWQTPITQAGLDTLRRLLRQTARKNTAVACHWIRGKNHSELLWIVGDARRFNAVGAVPTNTTRRNILKTGDENDWHRGEDIRLLAQLAALLHDLGKASRAFQARLRGRDVGPNLYRHEWVSLRLFQAFVGQDGDEAWLTRLAAPATWDQDTRTAPGRYGRDGLDAPAPTPFPHLPPLAAALAWLILSHHRLPLIPVKDPEGQQRWLGCRAPHFNRLWLEKPLALVTHDLNLVPGPGITPWGSFDLLTLLREQAEFLDLSLDTCARRFTTVDVPESPQGWRYHPWLGFTP